MPKILGKNSHFLINGVELPFREIDYEVQRALQENTGSTNYDPVGGVLYRRHRVVKLWLSFRVTGFYNTLSVPAALGGTLFSGALDVSCSLFQPGSVISGTGSVNISEFRAGTPFDNVVAYSLVAQSSGFWTPL